MSEKFTELFIDSVFALLDDPSHYYQVKEMLNASMEEVAAVCHGLDRFDQYEEGVGERLRIKYFLEKYQIPKIRRFMENMKWDTSGRLFVYRAIAVDSVDKIKLDSLGKCWSYVKSGARPYCDETDEETSFVVRVEAYVDTQSIDKAFVLYCACHPIASTEEAEIRLRSGTVLNNVMIYDSKTDSIIKEAETALA